jgi:hypothetical protein
MPFRVEVYMKNSTNLLVGACLMLTSFGVARADIIQASLFSPLPPVGSVLTPLSLSGISTPSETTINGLGFTVTFSTATNQGVVNGSNTLHAVPVAGVSGTTPEYLTGDYGSALTTDIGLAGSYLSTGTGTITITFATPQTSLALLWGSIDAGNTLTFNDAANFVVTGAQVQSAAAGFVSNGFQGPGGSAYVIIDSSTSFTTVTASSNVTSFEFDAVAGGTLPFSTTPEPASMLLMGGGLLAFASFGLRRRSKS